MSMKLYIVILAILHLGQCIILEDTRRGQCDKLGCSEIAPVVERLSKLSLLPDFVSQTLILLEDLMKEMEKELYRSAEYLSENIEPDCESLHVSLKKVIKTKGKAISAMQNLEQGTSQNNEARRAVDKLKRYSNSKEITQNNREENKYYQQNYNEDYFSNSRENYDESQGYQNNIQNREDRKYEQERRSPIEPQPPKQTSNSYNSWSHKKRTDQYDDKSYGQTYERGYGQESTWQNSGSSFEQDDWQQKSDQGTKSWNQEYEIDDYDQNGQTSDQWSSQTSGRGVWSSPKAVTGKWQPLLDKKPPQCRGVDKSSPYWVPGLDNWCKSNCAAGHCPNTHCVC